MMKYTIALAGSTQRTQQCAQTLLESSLFEIVWILTPLAKPTGRKQSITPNAMEQFATKNNLLTVFVEKKIDQNIQGKIQTLQKPDFLLVVDFGYIIPEWLLNVPKISPLNIHPSKLPDWRGSSPAQFSILFNDTKSAVTLMVMNEKLDQGAIIHQDFFDIQPNWTQSEYYQHAFNLICDGLPEKIQRFALQPAAIQNQTENSPTITAHTIKKEQTFVPWEIVRCAMSGTLSDTKNLETLPQLLQLALEHNNSLALTLERASKAFSPWPHLWTIINTNKGEKRMKLLEIELSTPDKKTNTIPTIQLKTVQIEGKNPTKWNDVKNVVLE